MDEEFPDMTNTRSNQFRAWRAVPFAGALVVTLALVGCGSGESDSAVPPDDFNNQSTQAYLKERAEAFARDLNIDNPAHVDPVRFISLSEWAPTQIDCLQSEGWDVGATEDGAGVKYPKVDSEAQGKSLNNAIYTCEMRYPVSAKYMLPLSDDTLVALYKYRTQDLVKCLNDLGYQPAQDFPSETVFVQSEGAWSPYTGLAISVENLQAAFSQCPESPDSIFG